MPGGPWGFGPQTLPRSQTDSRQRMALPGTNATAWRTGRRGVQGSRAVEKITETHVHYCTVSLYCTCRTTTSSSWRHPHRFLLLPEGQKQDCQIAEKAERPRFTDSGGESDDVVDAAAAAGLYCSTLGWKPGPAWLEAWARNG